MTTVLVGGWPLALLPEKAAFIAASGTLLVADAHIGKAVSFRALGVPVPRGTTSETLAGLSALVARTGARRIVFLGDFLHSARAHAAATLAALAAWREAHRRLELVLVRGNHDDRAGDPPAAWDVEVVPEPHPLAPFLACHVPVTPPTGYALCGHVHPGVHLFGAADDSARLPCFVLGNRRAILPAFGSFTGLAMVAPARGDRLVAIAGARLFALPATP